jgi:hypothetical protein
MKTLQEPRKRYTSFLIPWFPIGYLVWVAFEAVRVASDADQTRVALYGYWRRPSLPARVGDPRLLHRGRLLNYLWRCLHA